MTPLKSIVRLTSVLILSVSIFPAALLMVGGPPSTADGSLSPTDPMHTARSAHTATLLNDGTVMIMGGFTAGREGDPFASVERFDPKDGVFSKAGEMTTGRQSHTATVLPDGRLLIAGGYDGTYLASTELYHPASGTFSPGGTMTTGRIGHRATLLADGTVLIAGGATSGMKLLASSEIYDPATGAFTPAGPLTTARIGHTQTLLSDGRVLVTGGTAGRRRGGVTATAEVFDPASRQFTRIGDMKTPRHKHAAVLMNDGRVLIVGGSDERDSRGQYDTAEIFEPATGTFRETGRLHSARFKLETAVSLLRDGTVLVAGGADIVELFDPQTERFTAITERFDAARFFSTATLMRDGRVLIAGGYNGRIESTTKAWLYTP